jgi:hypothetical protein
MSNQKDIVIHSKNYLRSITAAVGEVAVTIRCSDLMQLQLSRRQNIFRDMDCWQLIELYLPCQAG